MHSINITVNNRKIELFGADSKHLVIVHGDHGEGSEIWEECIKLGRQDFTLAIIEGLDWEGELSPWEAEPLFKKAPRFTGRADRYLSELEDEIIPEILKYLKEVPQKIFIAGYSLAGLFALYTVYNSDGFDGVISASGSLWFPEFLSYIKTHSLSDKVENVYFSIGDREAKTKNPLMKTVEQNTREIEAFIKSSGINTRFELNEGGHFQDDSLRLAKGITWMLSSQS